MYSLEYSIETLSPLLLSDSNEAGGDAVMVKTMTYVPGTALLGVLAAKYIASELAANIKKVMAAHEDDDFYNWFLRGDIVFSNAYLCGHDERGERIKFYPVPPSLQRPKVPTAETEKTVYNLAKKEKTEIEGQLKSLQGYCHLQAGQIIIKEAEKIINFHHYRQDRLKGHSVSGGIFNYEALAAGQLFMGKIYGSKNDLDKLKKMVGNKLPAQLGRSRQTQYGQVEIEFGAVKKYEVDKDARASSSECKVNGDEVVLTFTSPVILLNEFGFPAVSVQILEKYLQDALKTSETSKSDFTVESYFGRAVNIENHLAVWKLKKPLDRALSGGSTYVLKFKNGIDAEIEEKLRQLEYSGLGERKNEGFGQLLLDWAISEQYQQKKIESAKPPQKPTGEKPLLVEEIFSALVREDIWKTVTVMALEDENRYKNKSKLSNSLLGRLELILAKAVTRKSFLVEIGKMRDTAREKLEACRDNNSKQTLYKVLIEGKTPEWQILFSRLSKSTGKVMSEVNFKLDEQEELKDELYNKYWQTFFRAVRRSNKKANLKKREEDGK